MNGWRSKGKDFTARDPETSLEPPLSQVEPINHLFSACDVCHPPGLHNQDCETKRTTLTRSGKVNGHFLCLLMIATCTDLNLEEMAVCTRRQVIITFLLGFLDIVCIQGCCWWGERGKGDEDNTWGKVQWNACNNMRAHEDRMMIQQTGRRRCSGERAKSAASTRQGEGNWLDGGCTWLLSHARSPHGASEQPSDTRSSRHSAGRGGHLALTLSSYVRYPPQPHPSHRDR